MLTTSNKYRIVNYAPKSSYGQLSIFYSAPLKIFEKLSKIGKIIFYDPLNLPATSL